MQLNFQTSRKVNYLYIAVVTLFLLVFLFTSHELWPFILGILLIFWANAIYTKMRKEPALIFFDGILTIKKLYKEYVYNIQEFISFNIIHDSEGTDSLYGVYLKDGKMKKKTLVYDIYEISLKTIQEKLNDYVGSNTVIDDLEREQQEREIRIILNNSVTSIILLITTMVNFMLAFIVSFSTISLVLGIVSLIGFGCYRRLSRKIARNNKLATVFTIISAILLAITLINFFITIEL